MVCSPHPLSNESWTMAAKSAGPNMKASAAPSPNAAALRFAPATRACMTWLAYVCTRLSAPASGASCRHIIEVSYDSISTLHHLAVRCLVQDSSRAAIAVPDICTAACSREPADPSAAAAIAADAGGMAAVGGSAFRSMTTARSAYVRQASGGCRQSPPLVFWPKQLSAKLRTLSFDSDKRCAQSALTAVHACTKHQEAFQPEERHVVQQHTCTLHPTCCFGCCAAQSGRKDAGGTLHPASRRTYIINAT